MIFSVRRPGTHDTVSGMNTFLDFEKPIAELEGKIKELHHLSGSDQLNIVDEVMRLQSKAERLLKQTYAELTPWQKTQVARHPERPHSSDYINELIEDFTPLAGDRCFGEDRAILGGIGRFKGYSVVVIGHEKGADTTNRVAHNFGMARPEGYRKAIRLMSLADRFGLPLITLIDTPGAYPGVGAEERGQAEAIARSTEACLKLRAPLISVVIGEGGSGGAIALASANHVIMLENAIYSVISPEGCASILWRSADKAVDAAEALNLTAQDLHKLKVIDEIIEEPVGGAHRAPNDVIKSVGQTLESNLQQLIDVPGGELRARRRQKYLDIGTSNVL